MFVRPYLAGMPIFVTIGQFIQKNYCEVLQVRGGGGGGRKKSQIDCYGERLAVVHLLEWCNSPMHRFSHLQPAVYKSVRGLINFCGSFLGSFPAPPPFKFNSEKFIQRYHNALKFGVVNKSTTVNRFVLHTLQRNITHLAVITRKATKKTRYFERGDWKRAVFWVSAS